MQEKFAALSKLMDTTFKITVDRGSDSEELIIHPVGDLNQGMTDKGDKVFYGMLYLSSHKPGEVIKLSPPQALIKAANECYVVTRNIFEALGQMITGVRSATELGGIIRIGMLAGDVAQQGFIALVLLTAMLSINLGFINLLPIPLLDGGHLLFYFFEAIMGKPVPEQVQEYAFRFGLVFLLGIMAFANLNDIWQLLPGD